MVGVGSNITTISQKWHPAHATIPSVVGVCSNLVFGFQWQGKECTYGVFHGIDGGLRYAMVGDVQKAVADAGIMDVLCCLLVRLLQVDDRELHGDCM